jgi:hypothetical protein
MKVTSDHEKGANSQDSTPFVPFGLMDNTGLRCEKLEQI